MNVWCIELFNDAFFCTFQEEQIKKYKYNIKDIKISIVTKHWNIGQKNLFKILCYILAIRTDVLW